MLPETCLKQPPYNNNHLSTILLEIQIYYLSTATTLQLKPPVYHITGESTILTCLQQSSYKKQPSVYHTYGDTTKLTFLQQPTYNNNHMFTILPGIQLYKPAYSNPLTITTTCLLYYWRYIYTYQPIAATLQ